MTQTTDRQPPTILLLEPDNDIRPLLKGNLERQGYKTLVALDQEDAIQRATYTPSIELILVNQFDMTIGEAIATGQEIRQSTDLSDATPIIILADGYTSEQEGQNVRVNDNEFVAYLEDGQQLLDLLASVLSE